MNNFYNTINNNKDLIDGVILKKLEIHNDSSGSLFETLRVDWQDVYNGQEYKFKMQYLSKTPSNVVRDADKWHVHKSQFDRFVCVSGRIITAIYDPRENSITKNKLNLFLMGPQKEEEMFMLIIPKETYHGFIVVSKDQGYLINFPTQLYNPQDEGRVQNNIFDWGTIRQDFNLPQ